jgi:hypothetical protein
LAKEAAEVGEHVVNMGAALNISAEQFNNLSGALSIVGGNADTLVWIIRQLQNATQTALSNPASPQDFAFRQLGIDASRIRQNSQRPRRRE